MYHENYFMFIHLDHLHSFFMSAKYENEKLKRLEDFLKGTYMVSGPIVRNAKIVNLMKIH